MSLDYRKDFTTLKVHFFLSHLVSLTAEQHTFNSLFAIIGDGVFGNALEIGGVVAEEAREFGITFVWDIPKFVGDGIGV